MFTYRKPPPPSLLVLKLPYFYHICPENPSQQSGLHPLPFCQFITFPPSPTEPGPLISSFNCRRSNTQSHPSQVPAYRLLTWLFYYWSPNTPSDTGSGSSPLGTLLNPLSGLLESFYCFILSSEHSSSFNICLHLFQSIG